MAGICTTCVDRTALCITSRQQSGLCCLSEFLRLIYIVVVHSHTVQQSLGECTKQFV